ncbi:sushi, von Willebrand factor type A, EGF and pentraxin domain-containing protein 1-like [Lineus longissimus]|uniref:sushi, von Willebrand factor type A, EGF and pentraxin domain-containing protein 1-like n=1 Tax=Lineus longissimus TaxID=88925 RepID=UPI00315D865C
MRVRKVGNKCFLPRTCKRCRVQLRCVRRVCRNPPEERNAYTTIRGNNSVPIGTSIGYRCLSGSKWDGSSATRRWCKQDPEGGMMWTKGPGIRCVPSKPCGEPPKATHAEHNGKKTTPALGKVTYKCKKGFKPRAGRDVVKVCTGDGQWDGPDIICDDDCKMPRSVMKLIRNGTLTTANASVNYTCNPGYEFPDKSKSKTWTCMDAMFMNAIKTSCQPIKCQLPNLKVPNVVEQFDPKKDTLDQGTIFIYRCKKGWEFERDDRIRCEFNGTWSGSVTCKLIDCGPPTEYLGVKVQTAGTTYGAVAKYKCLYGSKMTSPLSTATKICSDKRKWLPKDTVTCQGNNKSTGDDALDGLDF